LKLTEIPEVFEPKDLLLKTASSRKNTGAYCKMRRKDQRAVNKGIQKEKCLLKVLKKRHFAREEMPSGISSGQPGNQSLAGLMKGFRAAEEKSPTNLLHAGHNNSNLVLYEAPVS